MRKILFVLLLAGLGLAAAAQKAPKAGARQAKNAMGKPAMEFADGRFIETGKAAAKLFEQGRIEEWADYLSPDAVYMWSNGDSLAGRSAVIQYWRERWNTVVSGLKFSEEIWLPIQVNAADAGPEPGTWVLTWHRVDATYRNGKSLTFHVHLVHHFNEAGKIDRTINYMDHSKIREITSQ